MKNKIVYYPIELHSHTKHSDGIMTVEELTNYALYYGYKGVFISDHNTMSALEEVNENKLDEKIPVFSGVEWTTFYGHMGILGCKEVGEWTEATVENMDSCIEKIRRTEDVAIGVLHPYSIGNPVCTGCHWDYEIKDWNNIDYIEIYNSANPQDVFWNELAYDMWVEKLNKGYKIAATSGRDWHMDEGPEVNVAISYLGFDGEINERNSVDALKSGRIYATLGPRLISEFYAKKELITFGDTIKPGRINGKIQILETEIEALKAMNALPRTLRFYNNGDIIKEIPVEYNILEFELELESGYFRLELFGNFRGKENVRLITTSPIYIE